MNAKEVIRQVKEQCGIIRQVYWTACGGSLVDLYPAHCMLMGESTIVESGFYTAREFLLATPKKLGKRAWSLYAAIPAAPRSPYMLQSWHWKKEQRLSCSPTVQAAGGQ